MLNLQGWIPVCVRWEQDSPQVEWILLGGTRFTQSFFDDTIQSVLSHPFHHAFRRTTALATLEAWSAEQPGLRPNGFVFHMSRCGSTLLCQALAASERNIVLSEPPPVDSILRGHLRNPALTPERRAEALRWILSAVGQKRHPAEERLFVKLDCWSIPELPVVRLAFPEVPWIFLYRDPVEVLVSQLRKRAQWSVPGGLSPAVLGLEPAEMAEIPHDEYCARLLGRICEIALAVRSNRGLLVNYNELPDFFLSEMLRHFALDVSADERESMRQAAGFNSKTPGLTFEPDAEEKRNGATDRMRELAKRWITPFYEGLEEERCRQRQGS
jgi:hypothetical protein